MDDSKRLKVLSDILQWDAEEATLEFAWLKQMAAIKYDDYRDFVPGMRFFENLASWLQQFETLDERRIAYGLLRQRLIYVSPSEMQRLVEQLYPCYVERPVIRAVANRCKVPTYLVRAAPEANKVFERLRRSTLILGLSDGARIDILRHSTVGLLSNEQFVIQTQVDSYKWESLLSDLRADLKDPAALFEFVFLVDDFMGTGSSYLRYDKEKKKWKGKATKFIESLMLAQEQQPIMAKDWQLHVHHYLGTHRASEVMPKAELAAREAEHGGIQLERPSTFTFGAIVPDAVRVRAGLAEDANLVALTKKYYNKKIETKHTNVGGVDHIGLGYGECALPLILHHNTPNNSLALLWAETESGKDDEGNDLMEMRPLYRRRQRHT